MTFLGSGEVVTAEGPGCQALGAWHQKRLRGKHRDSAWMGNVSKLSHGMREDFSVEVQRHFGIGTDAQAG